jgi:hypothetical protein
MEIVIQDKKAYQHFMEERNIAWQLIVKRVRKIFLIQYGIGILLTIIGFSPIYDTVNKTEYVNNITHENKTIYEHSSSNLVGAFGLAYIVMNSVFLIGLFRRKEVFLDEAGLRGRKFFKQSNETTFIFRDENIIHESDLAKSIYKWEMFSSLFLYKDFIFLNIDKAGANGLAIKRELISEESYHELINFIKQKMPEKKV